MINDGMSINCLYRSDVSCTDGVETATCRLIASLVDCSDSAEAFRIPRRACESCEYRDTRSLLSGRPTFASLLYHGLDQTSDNKTLDDDRQWLMEMAERTMAGEVLRPRLFASFSCDIVIICNGNTLAINASLDAALNQDRVFPVVHLVGVIPDEVCERVRDNGHVVRHSSAVSNDGVAIAVGLLPAYRSEFICLLDCGECPGPHELGECIETIVANGSKTNGWLSARNPAATNSSLRVARRAAIADVREQHGKQTLAATTSSATAIGNSTNGRRFRCDVMLPFHGQLDYVTQAIESVLSQRDVDVVVHLIDDQSPESTGDFLKKWAADSRVRTYRNESNIGQFMSVNNAVEFAETDFVAVQDGDDISLPDRLAWSIETLQLTDADIFAGAAEVFEETPIANQPRQVRLSHYPVAGQMTYFSENPTLVMRRRAFLDLGGFADFGDRLANRCSVDTEFQTRAMLAGKRFAISDRTVLRYRSHAESSTNNAVSGWGSPARKKAENLSRMRHQMFLLGSFDPRSYGAPAAYRGVTRRITPQSASM